MHRLVWDDQGLNYSRFVACGSSRANNDACFNGRQTETEFKQREKRETEVHSDRRTVKVQGKQQLRAATPTTTPEDKNPCSEQLGPFVRKL